MTNKEKIRKDNLEYTPDNIITYSEFFGSDFILKKELQGWGEGIFCSEVFGE